MSIIKKYIPLLFLFTILAGCTTAYGPYTYTDSMGYINGGYKEKKLEDNSYIVSFYGNTSTGQQQIWNYWIYRCAELTLLKGYELFELIPSDERASLDNNSDDILVTFSMLPDPTADHSVTMRPAVTYQIKQVSYSSSAIVKMYKDPIPVNAGLLLDAAVIKEALKPYVDSKGMKTPPSKQEFYVRAAVEAAIRANRIKQEESESLTKQLRDSI